jgi:aminoglycoside 3-N-acetyltransferase
MTTIASIIAEKTKNKLASIHIDAIGLIRIGETNRERVERFNEIIMQIEKLGGQIMVPSFSYTYPKGEVFDILNTPSEVGLVTEYLRKSHPHKRTVDAFFSYLLFGDKDSKHFKINDYECFGDDSLISELFAKDGYVCCVGNVFHNTPTEIHYIERLLGVEYRFNKIFKGRIKDCSGDFHDQTIIFYCRKYLNTLFPDMTRLEIDLKRENMFEYWSGQDIELEIQAVSFRKLFEFVKKKLAHDPLYLCSSIEELTANRKERLKMWRSW